MTSFVVFEGIDGSGKSTQFKLLCDKLSEKGYKVWRTREPTGEMIGSLISSRLKKKTDLPSEVNGLIYTLLFYADRIEHSHEIKKEIKSGVVVSDRYYHSTLAYQQTQGFDMEFIMDLHKRLVDNGDVVIPDATFFIDVPADVAIRRIEDRSSEKAKVDIFERLEFLEKLRANYLNLKDVLDENIIVIDGTGSVEDVWKRVWEKFKEL